MLSTRFLGSGKEIVLVFRGPDQENGGHPEGFVSDLQNYYFGLVLGKTVTKQSTDINISGV